MSTVKSRLEGDSEGFDDETIFVLENGNKYKQIEYYYNYRYEYRPVVTVKNDREIMLNGINKVVRVERIF